MKFEFATATRILFGAGASRQLGELAKPLGKQALVVTGANPKRAEPLLRKLADIAGAHTIFSVKGEPDIALVSAGVKAARQGDCDFVVSIGGGSVIDTGKAIAAMLANPGDVLDYLEVVGRGQPLQNKSSPFIAIPTTAGTGSEVTRNAVLGSPEHRVKASLRSPFMLPTVALVDSELTSGMTPEITATTGLDALTQLIEPYVSSRANPLTDAICREGIGRAARALPRAFTNGTDADARRDMALCSLYGGMALANAGLGAVHGFAGPIGGMFPAPHGALCAALLPHVFEVNVRAARERAAESDLIRRFDEVAKLLTGHESARADDGVRWLTDLVTGLKIPPLGRYGLERSQLGPIVDKSKQASSMKANPIILTDEEMIGILTAAV